MYYGTSRVRIMVLRQYTIIFRLSSPIIKIAEPLVAFKRWRAHKFGLMLNMN